MREQWFYKCNYPRIAISLTCENFYILILIFSFSTLGVKVLIKSDAYIYSIYLIDHAWTFRSSDCRTQLEQMPSLVERMSALMEIKVEERTKEEVIEEILTEMWRYEIYIFTHNIDQTDSYLGTYSINVLNRCSGLLKHSICRYTSREFQYIAVWPSHIT